MGGKKGVKIVSCFDYTWFHTVKFAFRSERKNAGVRFEFSIELGEISAECLKAAAKSGREQEKPAAVLSAVTGAAALLSDKFLFVLFQRFRGRVG